MISVLHPSKKANDHRLSRRIAVGSVILLMGSLLGLVALPAYAQYAPSCNTVSCYIRAAGTHLTISDVWGVAVYKGPAGWNSYLSATLNMDTHLQAPAEPPLCTSGSTVELPITSTGELTGLATAWFGTPPITFHDDRTVVARTEGIAQRRCVWNRNGVSCADPNVNLTDFNRDQLDNPLRGTWNDIWQAQRMQGTAANPAPVTCQTLSASRAKCTFNSAVTGRMDITLKREIEKFNWEIAPVPAGHDIYETLANREYRPVGITDNNGNTTTGRRTTMTSTVRITCPQQPAPSPRPSVIPTQSVTPSPRISPPPPHQFPNLTVIEPKHTPAQPKVGDAIALEATVLSNGTAPTTRATTATARLDRGADGVYDETLEPKTVAALAVNARHLVQWPDAWVMTPGTHRYQICIDPQNVITELNEADNCITRTIVIAPLIAPDLALVHGVGVPNDLVVGQPAELSTTVFNIGTAAAGASTTGATVSSSTTAVGTVPTNALPPARFQEVKITWIPAIEGSQTVTLCADHTDVVTEINEDNNCAFRTVNVTGTPTQTGPDLAVVAMNFTTSSFQVGQPTSVFAFVVNRGQQAVTVPTTATLDPPTPTVNAPVNPLPAQQSERVSFNWTPTTADQQQVVRICADTTHVVTETNEDNNCDQRTVTVTANPGSTASPSRQPGPIRETE